MTTKRRTTVAASRKNTTRSRDLRKMLSDREHELEDSLRDRVRPALARERGDGLDETEIVEADVQEHIELALIQMKVETLKRVREALVRLDEGAYGYCAECAGEIAEPRLRALPFAVRCTACEERQERRAKPDQRSTIVTEFRSVFPDQAGS